MTQIDDEAVDTMALLDTQVRNKIRAELLDMVRNPRNDEERMLMAEVISAYEARQRRDMENAMISQYKFQELYQLRSAAAEHAARAQNYAAATGRLAEEAKPKPKPKSSWGFW